MQDEEHDSDLELGSGILDLTAALIPVVAAGDPMVVALGAFSALGLSVATKGVLGRRWSRRLRKLEEGMRDQADDLTELFHRVATIEDCAALASLALRSSIEASVDDQATANGRLLVDGVLGDQPREAEYAMRTLSRLSELEIHALQSLHEWDLSPGAPRPRPHDVIGAHVSEDLTGAVLGSLAGLGLLVLDPPGFPDFGLTRLGARIAEALPVRGGQP